MDKLKALANAGIEVKDGKVRLSDLDRTVDVLSAKNEKMDPKGGFEHVTDSERGFDYLMVEHRGVSLYVYPKSERSSQTHGKPGKAGKYLWEVWYDNMLAHGYASDLKEAKKDGLYALHEAFDGKSQAATAAAKSKYLIMVIEALDDSEDQEKELESFAEAVIGLTEEHHPCGSTTWSIVEGAAGESKSVKLP